MAGLQFWKMETVGNDFVVVREADAGGERLDDLAVEMCDRHFGVGSDGLLVLNPVSGKEYAVDMRMFNPDGTEDFCGNGLRCAAVFASSQGWTDGEFVVRQYGRLARVAVDSSGQASAWLPPASFEASQIPASFSGEGVVQGVTGTPVTTGSAHFVALVEELPGDEAFFALSPAIETDPAFPERVSVMWTQALSDRQLKLRIWERGVGETLGCGTGSSAAALVWARSRGLTGEFVVENPGGSLRVALTGYDEPIASVSRPRLVFGGVWG